MNKVMGIRTGIIFKIVALLILVAFFLPGCSPKAVVIASGTEGQAPFTVTFANTSKNADEYRWDFGDGTTLTTTSVEEPVSHEYTIAGTHTVMLSVFKAKSPDKINTATLTINVKPGVISKINVTPPTATLAIGANSTFSAQAFDVYGNIIPQAAFDWDVNQPAGTIAIDGTFTAGTKAGEFTDAIGVASTVDGMTVTAAASVTINPDPLAKVSLAAINIGAGESLLVVPDTTDQYDNPVSDATLAWSVLDENAGSVADTGMLTAAGVVGSYAGAIEVTATQGDIKLTATGAVTIKPGPLTRVFIGPDEVLIGLGMTQQMAAIGTDEFGNRLSGLSFTWSADEDAGTISAAGLFTASDDDDEYKDAIKAEATLNGVTCSATADVTVDPDHIAFMSDRNNAEYEFDLYIMEADGSNPTKLSSARDGSFDFSPDGNRIVFNLDTETMCTINTDGSWTISLFSGDLLSGWLALEPNWSPDGSKIVFQYLDVGDSFDLVEILAMLVDGSINQYTEIFVFDIDGGNLTQLTNNSYYDDYPVWSPDGTKILFISDRTGNNEIYVMNANGSNQRQLTNNKGDNYAPSWSPDGTEILFQSNFDRNAWGIFIMNADGTNVRSLTPNNIDCCLPGWSPDGTKIVFHGYKDSDNGEIYVMNRDGTNMVRLTNNSYNDWVPVWAPRKAGVTVSEASIAVAAANNLKNITAKEIAELVREATVRIETDLGSGSGFIITADGYILTNNHVVSDAEEITVYLDDGTDYEAEVIGRDLVRDIAVIKIDAEDLPFLEMGDPIEVDIGEQVVVLGYPLGDDDVSITSGIVSKIDFDPGRNITWIQTDSAVNPGNSGGPIFNMQGQVIGIISAKMVGVSVEGMGFAISANTVNTYLQRLMNGETIDSF